MSSTKELLAAKQKELASAQESVRDWEERDMERDPGSMAQDQRHAESGQRRRERVWEISAEIQKLQEQLEKEEAEAR